MTSGFEESLVAFTTAKLFFGDLGHARPHEAERHQTEEMHIVIGGCTGIVGLGHRILHQPHGGGLKIVEALLQMLGEEGKLFVLAIGFAEFAHFLEEGGNRATAIQRQLATDEIERLNAVCAFINHGDTRIAHILAHAVFFDITVTAEDLLRHDGVFKTLVGQNAFQNRRQKSDEVVCCLTFRFIACTMGNIGIERRPEDKRATGFVESADVHEVAANIRMHDDRIGLLVRCCGTGKRTTECAHAHR